MRTDKTRSDNDPEIYNRLPFLPFISIDPYDEIMDTIKVHAKLLAEMIPPLSSPAGGMPIAKLLYDDPDEEDRAIDLMSYRDTVLWDSANRPGKSERQQTLKRWLHGDYKDAPYLLTHKLYEKIKEITEGNNQ